MPLPPVPPTRAIAYLPLWAGLVAVVCALGGCGTTPQQGGNGDPAPTVSTRGVLGTLSLNEAAVQTRQVSRLLVLAVSDQSGDIIGGGRPAADGRFFVPVLDGSDQVILCIFSGQIVTRVIHQVIPVVTV